jgi:hypothetical protein
LEYWKQKIASTIIHDRRWLSMHTTYYTKQNDQCHWEQELDSDRAEINSKITHMVGSMIHGGVLKGKRRNLPESPQAQIRGSVRDSTQHKLNGVDHLVH